MGTYHPMGWEVPMGASSCIIFGVGQKQEQTAALAFPSGPIRRAAAAWAEPLYILP